MHRILRVIPPPPPPPESSAIKPEVRISDATRRAKLTQSSIHIDRGGLREFHRVYMQIVVAIP